MTGVADKLADIAAGAEPPAIDDGQTRRLVDRALGLAAIQPHARTSIRWAVAFAAMAAAAVVIVIATRDRASTDELHLTLPTGDRLVSAPGADFAVERLEPGNRELRLHRGAVRFEVAHVVSGQRFRVATDDLVVTAKGTVFSVDTDATGSRVRVLEGVVEIEQGTQSQLLAAGGEFDSRTAPSERAVVATSSSSSAVSPTTAPSSTASAPPSGSSSTNMASPPATTGASSSTASTSPPPVAPIPPSPTTAPSPAPPLTPESLDAMFTAARADLVSGKLTDALAIAKRVAARGPLTGPWWQLSGDALRGLGRFAEAANAFDAAAEALTGGEHVEAGYSAAYVRFHDLHDARTALASLDLATTDGSQLEERGLGLRAQILVDLGRRAEARDVATRYLQRFSKADLASYMRSLAR